jgi:hypothetical protein
VVAGADAGCGAGGGWNGTVVVVDGGRVEVVVDVGASARRFALAFST